MRYQSDFFRFVYREIRSKSFSFFCHEFFWYFRMKRQLKVKPFHIERRGLKVVRGIIKHSKRREHTDEVYVELEIIAGSWNSSSIDETRSDRKPYLEDRQQKKETNWSFNVKDTSLRCSRQCSNDTKMINYRLNRNISMTVWKNPSADRRKSLLLNFSLETDFHRAWWFLHRHNRAASIFHVIMSEYVVKKKWVEQAFW